MSRTFQACVIITCLALLLLDFRVLAQDPPMEEPLSPWLDNLPILYPNEPSWNKTEPKVICTSFVFTPMVFCDPTQPPETYTGFQIDLFKATAKELNWTLGKDFTFKCMDWLPQEDDLASNNGSCYMVASAIDVQTFHLARGIKFGNSYLQAGYKIMVASPQSANDPWGFMKAFSWEVWVLLLATALVVPTVAWFVEGMVWGPHRALGQHHQSYRYFKGLSNMFWHYSCMIVSFEPLDFRTWPSRILALVYGFLLTVTLALYTANTAAQLAVANTTSQIKSINDLQGKAVGTIDQYVDILNGYGVRAAPFQWSSSEDETKFKNDLLDGVYAAIIVDGVWVDYTASTDCRFRAVGPSFKLNNYALAFPQNFPDSTIQEWNNAQLRVQEREGITDKLTREYINIPNNCSVSSADVVKLSIREVAGLWYILAAVFAIAFIWMGFALIDPARRADAKKEVHDCFHQQDMARKSFSFGKKKYSTPAKGGGDEPDFLDEVKVQQGPTQLEIRGDVVRIRKRLEKLERELAGSNIDFNKPFQVVQ